MVNCTYWAVNKFSNVLLHLFFSDIEIVGKENLPKRGPVILVGNHKNQFVDSMVVLKGVPRPVSFIIAEVSMHKPVIGNLAKALHAVPVVRPQDKAVAGTGFIIAGSMDTLTLTGEGTKFTEECSQKGCQISIKGLDSFMVSEVVSDTELRFKPKEGLTVDQLNGEHGGTAFKVIPKLDQHAVFDTVHDLLAKEGLVAIFPEGGSHDRTDLLPLKAGVSIMALGAALKGTDVQIVPYGINYLAGHAFRSKVFVEIGKPLDLDNSWIDMYGRDQKREACNELLKEVEHNLRGVTINAPNYATLKILRTMRRMYQGTAKLSVKQYLALTRRFTDGYEHWKDSAKFQDLSHEVAFYLQDAHAQGLTDKQVLELPPIGRCTTWMRATFYLWLSFFTILILFPLALPGIILNYPVVIRTRKVVKREMAKALAGSKVKVAGRDVAATQTILVGLKTIPLLYTIYTVITLVLMLALWKFESNDGKWYDYPVNNMVWIAPLAVFLGLPFYSYFSMRVYEDTLKRYRMIPLLWMQLTSVSRRSSPAARIRTRRKQLVVRVQMMVEELLNEVPGWAEDRIINHDQLVAMRRKSDRLIASDLESNRQSVVEMSLRGRKHEKMSQSLLNAYEI